MPHRLHDDASSATIGILVALMILAPSVAYMGLQVEQPRTAPLEHDLATADAALTLDRILETPATAWLSDPENATALGLRKNASGLDAQALHALGQSSLDAGSNGRLDYAEARLALGVREGDFHLRVRPTGTETQGALPSGDWRVGYVAHYSGAAAPASTVPTLRSTDTSLVVELEVMNRADLPAVFSAEVALGDPLLDSRTLLQVRHTPLLAPGERHVINVTYSALAGWPTDAKSVWYSITDPYGKPALDPSGTPNQGWLDVLVMPVVDPAPYNLILGATQPYFVQGDPVSFRVNHFGSLGMKLTDATARIVLRAPSGLEMHNATIRLPSQPNKAYVHDCGTCTELGTYTMSVRRSDAAPVQVDHVHVSANRMFMEKQMLDPIARREIAYLQELVPSLSSVRHEPLLAPEGDIFGDDVNGPSEIARVLARYDLIVIGSDVDQDALMAAGTRHGLHEWLRAGGTLVVLGHQHQSARWLEATAQIGLQPSRSSTAVDGDHALLNWPAPLDIGSYQGHSRAWRVPDGAFDAPVSTAEGILLGVSRPGAYGHGTLVLSGYLPGLLTAPISDAAGRALLHNLLVHATSTWSLDYGPPVPDHTPVASWRRVVWADDERHGLRVLVAVELYRFR